MANQIEPQSCPGLLVPPKGLLLLVVILLTTSGCAWQQHDHPDAQPTAQAPAANMSASPQATGATVASGSQIEGSAQKGPAPVVSAVRSHTTLAPNRSDVKPPRADRLATASTAHSKSPQNRGAGSPTASSQAVSVSPANTERTSANSSSRSATNTGLAHSAPLSASALLAQGTDIIAHYPQLVHQVPLWLKQHPKAPKSTVARVAVVGAAAFFLAGQLPQARRLVHQAWQQQKELCLPASWQGLNWMQHYQLPQAQRAAKMKDFLFSCANAGFADFKEANIAFIAQSNYCQAVKGYTRALERGLEQSEHRQAAYLRLAACYFKCGQSRKAEEVFLDAWLTTKKIPQLTFGDRETKAFLHTLREKYQADTKKKGKS